MIVPTLPRQQTLQIWLYTGMTLVVVSMLFLGRGQENASFLGQALSTLAAPAFFYVVGLMVYRYANAPLAAPGIMATGAWLIGVDLIHLYDRRGLMPEPLQPYYWLAASVVAVVIITMTGHRNRIWMLVPLVPLVQANALWAVLATLGISVAWMPTISFGLVLLWWESPRLGERWTSIYRGSAAVLSVLLLVFTVWLPLTTPQSLMVTWGAGAVVVAFIGMRYGWLRLGPLAIVMLTAASIWGLPSAWWPVAWTGLAASAIVFIEYLGTRRVKAKDAKAMEIAQALAVALSGFAAVWAEAAPLFNVPIHPLATLAILAVAGLLMGWLGWRREILLATHVGLWLGAAAWASLYLFAVPDGGTFGLWLALFAVVALLLDRVRMSRRKDKRKSPQSLAQTMTNWPVADLVIGLSAFTLLWSAFNITAASTLVVIITFSVAIGLWLAVGLIYRLPVLLHVALWIFPLPYVLTLIYIAPWFWTLPLLGVAGQALALVYLAIGHFSPRYRPSIIAPFFLAAYALMGFGFTLAARDYALSPISLSVLSMTSIATSAAVLLGYHPVWTAFVAWLVPPERQPYAYQNANQAFLILSSFLTAVWLHLVLGYANLPLPRQGIVMVMLACAWFVLGRLLARVPGAIGWPLIAAGWLMWLTGLLEVFFAPREAIVTVILGLVVSGEALRRSRAIYWIPVMIMQILFTVLQIAWLLALPGHSILLVCVLAVSIGGMWYGRRTRAARLVGRTAALTGAGLLVVLTALHPDVWSLAALTLLPLAASLLYREWRWLWMVYIGVGYVLFKTSTPLNWQGLTAAGLSQWIIGAELLRRRPVRSYHSLSRAVVANQDWATPFLWMGSLCLVLALGVALPMRGAAPLPVSLAAMLVAAVYSFHLRIRLLPYMAALWGGLTFLIAMYVALDLPFGAIGNGLLVIGLCMTLLALTVNEWLLWAVRHPGRAGRIPIRGTGWWLRPLAHTSVWLEATSLPVVLILGSLYPVNVWLRLINIALLALVFWRRSVRLNSIMRWLCLAGALVLIWHGWDVALRVLYITGPLWQSVPLGIMALYTGRWLRGRLSVAMEIIGVLVLLAGAVSVVDSRQPFAPSLLVPVLHVAALLVYGYLAQRRVPFAIAGMILAAGSVLNIARINLWLLPLICGMLLLGGTLLLEMGKGRNFVERCLTQLQTNWQRWH